MMGGGGWLWLKARVGGGPRTHFTVGGSKTEETRKTFGGIVRLRLSRNPDGRQLQRLMDEGREGQCKKQERLRRLDRSGLGAQKMPRTFFPSFPLPFSFSGSVLDGGGRIVAI